MSILPLTERHLEITPLVKSREFLGRWNWKSAPDANELQKQITQVYNAAGAYRSSYRLGFVHHLERSSTSKCRRKSATAFEWLTAFTSALGHALST